MQKRLLRDTVRLGLLLLALSVVVAACGRGPAPQTGGPDQAKQPKRGGVMVITNEQNPVSLDPQFIHDVGSSRAILHMYDPLLRLTPENEIEPWLAEHYEASPDGMVYTFHLRRGVKFHDGTSFNAEAVKFNFERHMDPAVNTRHHTYVSRYVDRVEAVDEHTVKIYLKELDVDFPLVITAHGYHMISPTAVRTHGADFAQNPVGTGPFKFKSFEPDSHLEMVRNDEYWDGAPYLDGLRIRIIPEANVQILEAEAGNVDFAFSVQAKDVARLQSAGLVVVNRPVPTATFISMNLADGPTTELAVRRAIARAVDRDAIITSLLRGYGTMSRGGVPEGWPRHHTDVPMDPYDVAEAGRILDEAGWKLGADGIRYRDGQPLRVNVLSTQLERALSYGLMNQIIQESLTKIGIAAELRTLEWGAYLNEFRAGTWHVTFHAHNFSSPRAMFGAVIDPDGYWNVNQHGKATDPTLAQVADRIREIYRLQATTLDDQQRYGQWHEAQMLVQQHQLLSWLVHWEALYAIQPWVKDAVITSSTTDVLYKIHRVWLDKD